MSTQFKNRRNVLKGQPKFISQRFIRKHLLRLTYSVSFYDWVEMYHLKNMLSFWSQMLKSKFTVENMPPISHNNVHEIALIAELTLVSTIFVILSHIYYIEHVKCCLFIVYTCLVNYSKVGSIGILSSCTSELRWFKVFRVIAVKVYSSILLVSLQLAPFVVWQVLNVKNVTSMTLWYWHNR